MELLLHPTIAAQVVPERFQLGHTYVFSGQVGQGRSTTARLLARRKNCLGDKDGPCESCVAFEHGVSPDLLVVSPEGTSLGIEQVRALHQALNLSPYRHDSARFAIIEEAELLTTEAQNALLKLTEEPPPQTTLVLITSQVEALLTTIQSRARSLYFPPLPTEPIEQLLKKSKLSNPLAVNLAAGAPGLALRLAGDPKLLSRYQQLDEIAGQLLTAPVFDRLLAVKDLDLAPQELGVLSGRLVVRAHDLTLDRPSQALVGVEMLLRYLKSGVTARPALEALVLGS